MLCLDYGVAFFAHYHLSRFISDDLPNDDVGGAETRNPHPLLMFSSGALSGVFAAVVLYPIDLVRQSTVPKGHSHFSYSTIPFMTIYLGFYFSQPGNRRDKSLSEKLTWAVPATTAAALAELPFDKAKIAMIGSLRTAGAAALIRVPLGTALLLIYDHILSLQR